MRISAKADYAVRALLEISCRASPGTPVTSDEVAAAQQIPRTFLLAILADLRRAGLVRSLRGQAGGWQLARPAGQITLAEVIRAVDGPLASVQGMRPEALDYHGCASGLQLVWVAVRDSLREILEDVSLADVAAAQFPEHVLAHTRDPDAWRPH